MAGPVRAGLTQAEVDCDFTTPVIPQRLRTMTSSACRMSSRPCVPLLASRRSVFLCASSSLSCSLTLLSVLPTLVPPPSPHSLLLFQMALRAQVDWSHNALTALPPLVMMADTVRVLILRANRLRSLPVDLVRPVPAGG